LLGCCVLGRNFKPKNSSLFYEILKDSEELIIKKLRSIRDSFYSC